MSDSVRFFVVGDIGNPGPLRARVAEGMRVLAPVVMPSFVLTTGDNVYGSPNDEQFEVLRKEMLEKVGLPWYVTLGNHDVGGKEYAWHMKDWNSSAPPEGWRWYCPSPCYHLNAAYKATTGRELPSYLDIHVINTNKYNRTARAGGVSNGLRWWRDQKKHIKRSLDNSTAAWKIVVGHHPIEYIPQSLLEHRIPGIRFIPTTFMKGGIRSKAKGTSMRDSITERANLYLCGHQHLTAHIVRDEGDCEYSIIGNSSKVEDDVEISGDERASDTSSSSSDESSIKNIMKSKLKAKMAPKPDERYSSLWHNGDCVGFALVEASPSQLAIVYYSVDSSGTVREINRKVVSARR